MVGRRAAIKVCSIQVTGTFYRSYGWQGAAVKVYGLQVTGSFGNMQRKLTGAFDRRWFE
jgi:hypothetical protein